MLAYTAPKETFLDYDLEVYMAENSVFLDKLIGAKDQLKLLWNVEGDCASDIAREIRHTYKIRDHYLRQSLSVTVIISLYSVLSDNQSKCFARLLGLYKRGPLSQILTGLYKPLWEAYEQHYKQEILRLAVNRNNYYAHISKNKPTNEILSWEAVPGKYRIINFSDIIGDFPESIFSDQSLKYLEGLHMLLNFAQEKEIHDSMRNDIVGHLDQFRHMYVLE